MKKLHNQPPPWLDNAHKALDAAVAAAYGWDDYSPEIPRRGRSTVVAGVESGAAGWKSHRMSVGLD